MYIEGNEDDHSHQPYAEADKRVRSEAGQIQAVRGLGLVGKRGLDEAGTLAATTQAAKLSTVANALADAANKPGAVVADKTSNTDDWNGYRAKPLASTGVTVLGLAGGALAVLLAGGSLLVFRKRHYAQGSGRHTAVNAGK